MLGLVALVATIRLAALVAGLVADPTASYGGLGIAFVAAYLAVAAGMIIAAWKLANRPARRPWLLPVSVVVLAIGVRAVLALAFDAPLTGENGVIHEQAIGVLEGANCCFSHRPMGYPLALAGAYSLLGVGPVAIETLNVICAAITTWLVFDIGRVAWDRRVGVVAATTFAILPSQVLMVLPPLTEPLYTVAVTAIVRLAIGRPRRTLLTAAGVGLAIAAAQYVRATAASLLAPIMLLPLLAGDGLRRSVMRAGITVAAFGVAMLPVISFNLKTHGDLSVSTSAYAGWSLYVGANQESAGRFNREDSNLFASLPGESAWERSELAGALGIRRILDDPGGYIKMQPRKFAVLWGDESYAGAYAFVPAGSATTRETEVAWLVSQLFYVAIVLIAFLGVVVERGRARPAVLLIGMTLAIVAATHAILEVHSRYHAYLMPLLVLLAAGGVDAIIRQTRARDPTHEDVR